MFHVSDDVPMSIMVTRRTLIGGSVVTVLSSLCGCGRAIAQDAEDDHGCWLPRGSAGDILRRASPPRVFSEGDEPMESRSGNSTLDRALARGLATISKTFGVLPGFAYYREQRGINARASPENLLQRTDGTVVFGLGMLSYLLQKPHADAAILAVCAHEFGHILSYKNGMIDQLATGGAFRAEQFADFMAGYFAGSRRLINPDYPAVVFATTQNAFGGGDHGTGEQRGEAVQTGYLAAYQKRLTINDAAQEGFTFSMGQNL